MTVVMRFCVRSMDQAIEFGNYVLRHIGLHSQLSPSPGAISSYVQPFVGIKNITRIKDGKTRRVLFLAHMPHGSSDWIGIGMLAASMSAHVGRDSQPGP